MPNLTSCTQLWRWRSAADVRDVTDTQRGYLGGAEGFMNTPVFVDPRIVVAGLGEAA